MSDAPDPDNEKLLRELDEQTKSLKEYLASHPSKEGSADDPPLIPTSPLQTIGCILLALLGFGCLLLALIFAKCAL